MACNPQKIIAALHEEKENISDIVYERINVSDRMVLRKIPDGGVVRRDSNQESIIYGEAQQASVAYRSKDHDPRELESGEMSGKALSGRNGLFTTNIQSIDENACHGFCTIQFGQGFRRRGYQDYDIDLDTPIKCARELDRLGKAHIEGYFEGFRRHFTKFGFDNFSDNLLNLVIQNGEANASVLAADQFNVTTGGFQAPPNHRISIHFLQDYRDHIMAEMEMLAMDVPENWRLEVEMPRDDWFDAVKEHQIRRHAMLESAGVPLTTMDVKILEDPEDPMRRREFNDYGNIRCFFNERPIRGIFKPVGDGPVYEFVRVNHWLNEIGEEGGLVIKPNHDYREDRITIDGVRYDMVTLIPHIHPKSFKRFGLVKPLKPMGEANMGVNYEVKVVDGAYIPGNVQNDKFGLAARHEFRFKTKYPELSGFIAYRHGRRPGYAIDVVPRAYVDGPDQFVGPQTFDTCNLIDPVTEANCAECGEVPTIDGSCVVSGAGADGVVGLDPAPVALTTFNGTASTVTIAVRRTGELEHACTVNYATADVTALAATHYTAVSGTLAFAVGQEIAYITIPIIGGSGDIDDDKDFTLTLSGEVDCTLNAGADVTTVTIEDIS